MSVGHGHGEGSDKQFVDTVGGYTGLGGHDICEISIFDDFQSQPSNASTDFTVYWASTLTRLVAEAGPMLPKAYQFYRVSRMEIWIIDIDYGQNWNAETQGWHGFLAPWKNTPYINTTTQNNLHTNVLPGCIWKNFTGPSIGSRIVHSPVTPTPNKTLIQTGPTPEGASSGESQVFHLAIDNPVFIMDVYNSRSTDVTGQQCNNTFIPTYTRYGIDQTAWRGTIARFKKYSGSANYPAAKYFMGMLKITYQFKGFRMHVASNIDDVIPTKEDVDAAEFIIVEKPTEDGREHDKRKKGVQKLVPNSKKRKTSSDPQRTPRLNEVDPEDSNRSEGDE